MRITGGRLVGRTFLPPTSTATRPMMDRVRQALFNVIMHREWPKILGEVVKGVDVLDAFCGTGALAFEAISHGARHATLFDKDADAQAVVHKNIRGLKVSDQCSLVVTDTLHPPPAPQPCKLIFLAPPYRKGLIPPAMVALDRAGWFDPHPLLMAETSLKEELSLPEGFVLLHERGYADTRLNFVVRQGDAASLS